MKHRWRQCPLFKNRKVKYCPVCGVVKNSLNESKDCKGPTKMRPMEKPLAPAALPRPRKDPLKKLYAGTEFAKQWAEADCNCYKDSNGTLRCPVHREAKRGRK